MLEHVAAALATLGVTGDPKCPVCPWHCLPGCSAARCTQAGPVRCSVALAVAAAALAPSARCSLHLARERPALCGLSCQTLLMAASRHGLSGKVSADHCHCQKGCFCVWNENLPSLCGALALSWSDESGKDACVGSVVLGVIVLSPVLVLPLSHCCAPSVVAAVPLPS